MKELVFYYDVICPYAYLASRLVEDLSKRTGALLKWRPVLLGGIYKATKSPSDLHKSAKDSMCTQKRAILGQDLARLYKRNGIPISPFGQVPDIKTLYAMRLIASTPNEMDSLRVAISHELFDLVWVRQQDVGDLSVLKKVADKYGINGDIEEIVCGEKSLAKQKLISNTEQAVKRGAFGVPSFWLNDRLYFGADRMHFVEGQLASKKVQPQRLQTTPLSLGKTMKLTIFHDLTSPWSFLGYKQINDLVRSVAPVHVEVEWVPILLGALFNAIGTPQVPLMYAGENKRNYLVHDLHDWCSFLNIPLKFPANFPFNIIMAARVTIAEPDDKLRNALYEAGWLHDRDIGDPEVIRSILEENRFNADEVMCKATSPEVKLKLRENTQRAIDSGLCGVPSYQVNGGSVIWGQDRLNVVADLLCGYPDDIEVEEINSKL